MKQISWREIEKTNKYPTNNGKDKDHCKEVPKRYEIIKSFFEPFLVMDFHSCSCQFERFEFDSNTTLSTFEGEIVDFSDLPGIVVITLEDYDHNKVWDTCLERISEFNLGAMPNYHCQAPSLITDRTYS